MNIIGLPFGGLLAPRNVLILLRIFFRENVVVLRFYIGTPFRFNKPPLILFAPFPISRLIGFYTPFCLMNLEYLLISLLCMASLVPILISYSFIVWSSDKSESAWGGKMQWAIEPPRPIKPEKNIEWALRQNRPGCWLSQNVSLRCFSMFVQVHLWLPTYGVACDFLVWSHCWDFFLAQHGCFKTLINDKWQNVLKRIWDAWDVWASCTWDELSDAKDFNNLPMCESFVRAKLQEAKEQKCQSKPQPFRLKTLAIHGIYFFSPALHFDTLLQPIQK